VASVDNGITTVKRVVAMAVADAGATIIAYLFLFLLITCDDVLKRDVTKLASKSKAHQ